MKYLAIIPAYNEGKSISNVIKKINNLNKFDVLVVNDGSIDDTSLKAREAGADFVVDVINNLGIGGAVQTGYKFAYYNDYDYAVQIDGDGQHDPSYLIEMLNKSINENIDILIGSRFIAKTRYKQTLLRKLGGNIISVVIKLMSKKKIYDPLSGFRLVNRKIIEEFAKSYPTDYPEAETNLKMLLKDYKVEELSMEMNKRENGHSFVTPFTAIWYMIKVSMALIIVRIRGGNS